MSFPARFPGTCPACTLPIVVGQPIGKLHAGRSVYAHVDCSAARDDSQAEAYDQHLARRPRLVEPLDGDTAAFEAANGVDLRTLPAGTTRYAVEVDGVLAFYRIDRIADDAARWAGNVYVKTQHGPRDTDRAGYQPRGGFYIGDHAAALLDILRDPAAAAARYGLELGRCGVCNTELTDPESRALGIGPVCRKRYQLPRQAVAAGQEELDLAA